MAHVPRPHVVSGASPVRLLALSLIPLAAVLVQVARLKVLDSGGVLSSGLAEVEPAEVGAAEVGDESETDDEEDFEAHRRTALKLATEYADALDIDEPRTLSQIRDILRRLRDFTASLILHIEGESNDAHSDLPEGFDGVLRDIQSKYDGLDTLATQKESEGEVDDGGDVLPSERDNICNTIDVFDVDDDLSEDVESLCKSLDHIRGLVLAHMDLEASIFEISGRLGTLDSHADYDLAHISDGVAAVLEQERIWITHRLADESSEFQSPESREIIFEALNQWMTKDEEEQGKGLLDMYDLARGASVDEHLSLAVLRTSMYRLDSLAVDLADFMSVCKDPDVCARGEELSRMIHENYDALTALAEQKEKAGEVDEVAAMFPSQRNNICKNIDGYGLDPRMQTEVVHLCEALDRWRTARLAQEDEMPAVYEVSGRLAVLKKPGRADKKIVDEMDALWTEEWRWREASEPDLESDAESGAEAA